MSQSIPKSGQKTTSNSGNKENNVTPPLIPSNLVSSTKAHPTKKRAIWTSVDDSRLISYLETCTKNGNVSDNGFKKAVWEGAAEVLNNNLSQGGCKTFKSCQDRYTAVSSDYTV